MKQKNEMNWKKFTMGALLLVLFAALMSAASMLKAQDKQSFGEHRPPMERALGPKGEHRWWNEPNMITKLNLTEAQRKDMDAILDQHRLKLVDLHANLDKAEIAMEPLMKADQPNEGKILSQIDVIADARKELEKANARFLLAIRSKLTPDQWKQLETLRAAHHEHAREGERRGPEGHGNWNGQHSGQMPPPPPSGAGPNNSPDGAQRTGPGPNPGLNNLDFINPDSDAPDSLAGLDLQSAPADQQ